MIEDTLNKLEKIINDAKNLNEGKRGELINLTEKLKKKLAEISSLDKEHARSIAGFAKMAAHESLRENKDKELMSISNKGMMASVRKFEASHPDLVSVIQSISVTLSNLGI